MEKGEKINWSALEYEEKERNIDWFWALGVIVVAGSVTSVIFGNYFFALLLIIGGVLLGVFAIKKPEMVSYELNDKGFQIKTRIYPYEEIKAFVICIINDSEPLVTGYDGKSALETAEKITNLIHSNLAIRHASK